MAEKKAGRTDVTDPVTGEPMVLDTDYSADRAADRVVRNTANPHGAQRVVDAIATKEREAGRLYVNPRTGYRMRVKDDAGSGEAGQGEQGQQQQGAQSW
jgi:hypothetical protein